MDNRFIPWFKVEFESLPSAQEAEEVGLGSAVAGAVTGAAAGALAGLAAGGAAGAGIGAAGGLVLAGGPALLSTLVPISRDFFEGDFRVEMSYAVGGNKFEAVIAGLSGGQYQSINVNQTVIKISLGYYFGKQNLVFEGIVTSKQIREGDCFYETVLSGVEKAQFLLERTRFSEDQVAYEQGRDVMEILDDIGKQSQVVVEPMEKRGISASDETRLKRELSFEGQTGMEALRELHSRVRQIPDRKGYSLFLRDNKIWYSKKNGNNNNTGEELIDFVYTLDNYLVRAEPKQESQSSAAAGAALGAASALGAGALGGVAGALAGVASGALLSSQGQAGLGFKFIILGDPELRPGDTLKFKIKDEQGVESEHRLTIESITHDFSRANGYRCSGQALDAESFLSSVYNSRSPSATTLREAMEGQRERSQKRNPTVNTGDITSYDAPHQLVDVRLGLQAAPNMSSPSVQIPAGGQGYQLKRRPIVSPFAWNMCGLVVPIYSGMRAVGLHNQFLREDALINGFIWTEEMQAPPSQAGDYWLCLPVNAPSDRSPNNSDKAANDLITGDGKRLIQLKGLKIQIGQGLLPNLGTRPTPGEDDELLIEFGPDTQIKMTSSQIEMKAGGRTMTIGSGKVSVS